MFVSLTPNTPTNISVSAGSYYIEFRKGNLSIQKIRLRIKWDHNSSSTPPTASEWGSSGKVLSSLKLTVKSGMYLWIESNHTETVGASIVSI